tara:strand:+ start:242 stop:373 length:132 start_codon:yes stop_codon:yes gene_type:complete
MKDVLLIPEFPDGKYGWMTEKKKSWMIRLTTDPVGKMFLQREA